MDEVAVVRAVLASMGVTDYDPKVATLLAEYLRRTWIVDACFHAGGTVGDDRWTPDTPHPRSAAWPRSVLARAGNVEEVLVDSLDYAKYAGRKVRARARHVCGRSPPNG